MTLIDAFVREIIAEGGYAPEDAFYLYNRVLALVGEGEEGQLEGPTDLIGLKDQLVELAVRQGRIKDSLAARECLGAELMNFITPLPSAVNRKFWETYQASPEQAIADFYALSKKNDYIKLAAIAKNQAFTTPSPYGDMEITINLSKPEKDPKDIAAAKAAQATAYPLCQLCMENEGYQGRADHPARSNHRIIRMDLGGQTWGFQYSPYAYFNEHSIILDSQHQPMVISRQTFDQLLTIVDLLPGYFAGSNSDLPIVGGSILSHNHYQAGRHIFPMERAELEETFCFAGFSDVTAAIVKWPMSVLRLRSHSKEDLIRLAEKIRQIWRGYSDPSLDILAVTDGTPHHTLTPIARKRGKDFELDLVLRDNHTNEAFPDGVYHPHPDVQHIKKENIGLIEVMGLAILPPRLKEELTEVENYIVGQDHAVAAYHKEWADKIKAAHPQADRSTVSAIVRQAVGQVFVRVLEDAGVYKRDAAGQAGFRRFIQAVNQAD